MDLNEIIKPLKRLGIKKLGLNYEKLVYFVAILAQNGFNVGNRLQPGIKVIKPISCAGIKFYQRKL